MVAFPPSHNKPKTAADVHQPPANTIRTNPTSSNTKSKLQGSRPSTQTKAQCLPLAPQPHGESASGLQDYDCDVINQVDAENDGFTTVTVKAKGSKQTRTRKQIVVGTGKPDDTIQTVERFRYIQAWSFQPDTTTEVVYNFMNKLANCKDYTVEKRDIKTNRHASFVIGFPESLYTVLTDASKWPMGVRFVDWFPARPRQQRGEDESRKSTTAATKSAAK